MQVEFEYSPLAYDRPVVRDTDIDTELLRPSKKEHRDVDYLCESGLEEVARYGGYATYDPPGNVDPYVHQAMKAHDKCYSDSLWGSTRRGAGVPGMYDALYKFVGIRKTWEDLTNLDRSCFIQAIFDTRDAFRLPTRVHPLDFHEVGYYLRRDTSAGISFLGHTKGEVMEDIYTHSRWLAHRMKQGGKVSFDPQRTRFPVCMAGRRGHLSEKTKPKTRLVWVYPAEMLVIEGLYAPKLYEAYNSMGDSNPMLSGKTSNRLFTEWISGMRETEETVGLDFSRFDTTIPAWLIRTAFDIVKENIIWDEWHGKTCSPKERQKWKNVWDGVVWYFTNTPILMPDGRLFRKHKGIPSGSWFTQLVGSVINYILIKYVCLRQSVPCRQLRVLGDDSGFKSKGFSVSEAADALKRSVGMVVNLEKSEVQCEKPGTIKLLGYTYTGARVSRPDDEWMKMALYPERPPRNLQESLSRLVGLWITGAMFSMRFNQFFMFYQSGYPCPTWGKFSRDQRRWMSAVLGTDPGPTWDVRGKDIVSTAYTYCY